MNRMMVMVMTTLGMTCFSLLAMTGLIACERPQPPMEVKQGVGPVEPVPAADSKREVSTTEIASGLMTPERSAGRGHDEEGVVFAEQGRWDVVEGYSSNALQDDMKLAEAQFNLGVTLDKLGRHDEAKAAFEKAAELKAGSSKITDSPVLNQHTST